MTLNMQQCRELFQAVERSGLNPRECELKNVLKDRWTHLTHMQSGDRISICRIATYGTEYWFVENRSSVTLAFALSLNRQWKPESPFILARHEWHVVLARVEDWTSQIAAARDVWRSFIANYGIPAGPNGKIDNTPFNASEREKIRERLHQIPAQVREHFNLSAEQESDIEQKLDDLIAASERVGKRDWLVMVYGAAFGLIVNDEIPAHVVQSTLSMIVSGLAHAFGIGGTPPFIPPHA